LLIEEGAPIDLIDQVPFNLALVFEIISDFLHNSSIEVL